MHQSSVKSLCSRVVTGHCTDQTRNGGYVCFFEQGNIAVVCSKHSRPISPKSKATKIAVMSASEELANAVSRQWVVQNHQAERKSTAPRNLLMRKIRSAVPFWHPVLFNKMGYLVLLVYLSYRQSRGCDELSECITRGI